MPVIEVDPNERLVKIFKRKISELKNFANELVAADFVRRNNPAKNQIDSGLSLFRVGYERITLPVVAKILAKVDYLHYGVARIQASTLLERDFSFTNRSDNHPWHTCARCPHCSLDEVPTYCNPSEGDCPFTVNLQANEKVRELFKVAMPATIQPEFLKILAVQETVEEIFEKFEVMNAASEVVALEFEPS